jgi:transposase
MAIRKTDSGKLKGKVAVEAVKEDKTLAELASQSEGHPTQMKAWKRHLLAHVEDVFVDKRRQQEQEQAELVEEL